MLLFRILPRPFMNYELNSTNRELTNLVHTFLRSVFVSFCSHRRVAHWKPRTAFRDMYRTKVKHKRRHRNGCHATAEISAHAVPCRHTIEPDKSQTSEVETREKTITPRTWTRPARSHDDNRRAWRLLLPEGHAEEETLHANSQSRLNVAPSSLRASPLKQ